MFQMCKYFAREFLVSCYSQTIEYRAIWRQSTELERENDDDEEEEEDETGEERKGENTSNGK